MFVASLNCLPLNNVILVLYHFCLIIQECLISGRLETAASYLIILQNLEKPIASRQVCVTYLILSYDIAHFQCNITTTYNFI